MAKNPRKPLSPTKKHLARVERERRQRRIVLIASAVVVALVAILVAYGVLYQKYFIYQQAVSVVNGEKITTARFQAQTRFARVNLIRSASQTAQYAELFGNDANMAAQLGSQLQRIQSQLEPLTIGKQVLDELVDDALIRQEAKKRGITVSKEEIETEFQEQFGYFANGTATPASTSTPQATSTLSALQMTLVPPTPTATATPVITMTATPTAIPSPTAVLTPTATATPYTLEGYQREYGQALKGFKDNYNISEEDLRYVIEMQVYRRKLQEAITAETPHSQEMVWARHILVADETAAKDVIDRLNKGEDFATLAKELSTDTGSKDNGGDLGWFAAGRMVAEFNDAAFALEVGQISEPVKTNYGYHIIQALGHEERPVSDAEYDQLKSEAFQNWLTSARESATIETKDYWSERAPTEPALPSEIEQVINQLLSAQQSAPTETPLEAVTPAP